MSEANRKAAEIRAFAAAFHIAGNAVVTFQREGRRLPEMVRLNDLLKKLEHERPEQLDLFGSKKPGLE